MGADEQVYQLPKSRLALRGAVLEKSTSDGKLVARHNLVDISRVAMLWRVEYLFVVMTLVFGAGGGVACACVDTPWLRWTGTILLVLLACLCAAITQHQYLEIQSGEDAVRYSLDDDRDENDGFVMTVKREFQRIKQVRVEQPDVAAPASNSSADAKALPTAAGNERA